MFVVSRDMKYDLAKQDPEVSEQESTKWVDKSLRALTRPVHKSFSGFVLSLYYISYLHMISKTAKKVKTRNGEIEHYTMYENCISENFNQKYAKKCKCKSNQCNFLSFYDFAYKLAGKNKVQSYWAHVWKIQCQTPNSGNLFGHPGLKISITIWDLVALYVQNLLQKYEQSTCCGGLHTLSTCCTCTKIKGHFEYMRCTILWGTLSTGRYVCYCWTLFF